MKWTTKQIIYFLYSIISFVFLAVWASEPSFFPYFDSWTFIGVFAIFFVALPIVFFLDVKTCIMNFVLKTMELV